MLFWIYVSTIWKESCLFCAKILSISNFMTVWKIDLGGPGKDFLLSYTYVPTFKYILHLNTFYTAQWNFLHSFLSSVPLDVFGFIFKFQMFFEKLALFRGLGTFLRSVQFHFNYLQVVTAQWNFLHNFLALIPHNFFKLLMSRKNCTFLCYVHGNFIYRLLTILELSQLHEIFYTEYSR